MEFFADLFVDQLAWFASPGVVAGVAAVTLLLASGLAARLLEFLELMAGGIHRSPES